MKAPQSPSLPDYSSVASKSRLRRLRATASKNKWYERSCQYVNIESLATQISMLTIMVGELQQVLTNAVVQVPLFIPSAGHGETCTSWNPDVQGFAYEYLDAASLHFINDSQARAGTSAEEVLDALCPTSIEQDSKPGLDSFNLLAQSPAKTQFGIAEGNSTAARDQLETSTCACVHHELRYRLWVAGDKDVFNEPGSAMEQELKEEAATTLQKFWRRLSIASSSLDSDSAQSSAAGETDDGSEHGSCDDNSAEAVAVRRAFMTSVASATHTPPSLYVETETWSFEQILAWLDPALELANATEDSKSGAKAFWSEWSKIEYHVPGNMRTKIVNFIDERLHLKGFPSLRDLVSE